MNKTLLSALIGTALISSLSGCSLLSGSETNRTAVTVSLNQPKQIAEALAQPLLTRQDLLQGQLSNGMNYILLPNNRPEGRVSLQLIVHAGSLVEEDDQKGIAHLVEHMAFNGTTKFPSNRIIEHQESLGMVFGRDVNAMTEYTTTSYYLHLPNNSDAMLHEAFTMFAQQATSLVFDPLELENERPVVEEEWRRSLNMISRLGTANRKLALAGSRYGERDPIGDMDLVRNVSADRIEAFWHSWYHPNNMTLLAVGNITQAQLEQQLQAHFGALPAQTLPTRPDLTVHFAEQLQFRVISDAEISNEVVSMNLLGEQTNATTEAELYLELLNNLLMSMLDNRLSSQYQTESDYVSRMIAGTTPLANGYNRNQFMAVLKDQQYQAALSEMFHEVSRYVAHGFYQQDLDQARNTLSTRYRAMRDSQVNANNSRLMMGIFNQIRQVRPLTHPDEQQLITQRLLDSITVEQVHEHLKQVVQQRSPMVIAQVNSANEHKLPDEKQIRELWQQALSQPPAAIVQNTVVTKLFDERPEPADVVATETFGTKDSSVHKWVLANGVEVWFTPSDETLNSLQINWHGPGGTKMLPEGDRRAVSLAARNLGRFGYGGFDADALRKLNSAHDMRLNAFVSQNEHGIFGSTVQDSLEAWLQNLNLMLTQPQQNDEVWADTREFTARNIERRKLTPVGSNEFNQQIDAIRYINNPSLLPATAEEIRALTSSQLLKSYQQVFSNVAGHKLMIVGNDNPERVIDLARRYVGRLPAQQQVNVQPLPKLASGRHHVRVAMGSEPQATTTLIYNSDYPYSIEAKDQAALLAQIVSLRLRETLREEAGGVYTTRFGINLDKDRQQAFAMVSYSHQPQRAEELKALTLTIINDVVAHGVTEAELTLIKEQNRTSLADEMITDRHRFSWLKTQLDTGVYQAQPMAYLAWLETVKATDLLPIAQKVLGSNNVIDALLLPEA